ncbi:NgoFVII family restriction endonuclease [Candidatus Parcubacteria bacterium]|nr:NgoFVII family restriction endonuclease [Patescibacteria group bacterium]MBU4309679.1 NgoFVII family restriction endonuclease [Patescibacteria group bacterium]MBU4432624.1 NgoFVII family restriction endonuclease [Patescibacteria group bacterium]MBU4577933.1 NgoFVII family restriction endonuclease [Patescibacteria group bacterium]MCG2696558.1 NgoFVII family restriction endonuclease [Candidatus Parcubacteria bacterium]
MLFTKNLEEVVFTCHNNLRDVDELIILSGYLGPNPVARLEELPFGSKIIYGMYGSEGIKSKLHNSLKSIQESSPPTLNIYYSKIPVHSKCYLWRRHGEIIHALIGSANFSVNGLTTPLREVLADVPTDIYSSLNDYVELVLANSVTCLDVVTRIISGSAIIGVTQTGNCLLSLLMRDGEIHNAAGLNWGQNPNNHTNPNDAYIPITVEQIRAFPLLFPQKQIVQPTISGEGRAQRHNDSIDIIWDDGRTMRGLLEGNAMIDEVKYPKQISSSPVKCELGKYIRERIGVPLGQRVTKSDLENYGRTNIEVTLLEDGIYSFDFSV